VRMSQLGNAHDHTISWLAGRISGVIVHSAPGGGITSAWEAPQRPFYSGESPSLSVDGMPSRR